MIDISNMSFEEIHTVYGVVNHIRLKTYDYLVHGDFRRFLGEIMDDCYTGMKEKSMPKTYKETPKVDTRDKKEQNVHDTVDLKSLINQCIHENMNLKDEISILNQQLFTNDYNYT